jgi:ATP-dependent DNA helicase RecQ
MPRADVDEDLREYLRQWRRDTAREQGTPAFVVMHDSTLDEVCQKRPSSIPKLLQITGFGQRKAEMYGPQLFAALARYNEGARATAPAVQISRPAAATKQLLDDGQTFAEIAAIRGRQVSTIITSVAELIQSGDLEFKDAWVDSAKLQEIKSACERLGTSALRPIKDAVSPEITYEDIKLVSALVRWEAKQQKQAAG